MADEQLEFGDDESSIALKRAWLRALQVLATKVNKASFVSWIRPIRPLAFHDRQVTLGAASPFARDRLKKYATDIQTALEEQLGTPLEVCFSLITAEERSLFGEEPTPETPAPEASPSPAAARVAGPSTRPHSSGPPPIDDIPTLALNERYTFESFVVGSKSNRLAHAGAMAVAGSPGAAYNPLFLYGSSGLGKTHLLHAIGNAAKERNNNVRVAVIDGENFTQYYVAALREGKMEAFRRHYRGIDLWLVDDIQFIAGKQQTKEEFFHTFNALYQTGRQIVITSDRSPRELRMMDERLRSRFECGLIADINPPELETRTAILERRCLAERLDISADVLFYIASAIQSNIRTLQGALTRLVAYASVMNTRPSMEVAQNVLLEYYIEKPLPGQAHKKNFPVETILRAVAEEFGTSVEALRSERRDKEIVKARQVAMYLCRELAGLPLAQVGAAMGGRDHTTVQRAIAKLEGLLHYDRSLHTVVQGIQYKLEQ